MKKILLSLLFIFATSACTDSKDESHKNIQAFQNEDYASLLKEIEQAIQDKERQLAFSSYSVQDDTRLSSALETSKGGLLSLASGTDLYSSYIRLGTALKSYESMMVLERDQGRLDKIFNQVKSLYNEIALRLGKEGFAEWNLYNYNFSAGIEPEFKTSGAAKWGFNVLIDIPKAQISGPFRSPPNAWLISKTFDLSEVKNASLRFFTVLSLDPDDSTVNKKQAIEEYFQVYVISNPDPFKDYSRLSNEELASDKDIHRIKYSSDELPIGENFHKSWTPTKSLAVYTDKPLAIAFRFNPTERGYYNWQVLDVEINGAGKIKEGNVKKSVLFVPDEFPRGFHKASMKVQGNPWKAGRYGAQVDRGAESEAWLLSPKYFISQESKNVKLNVQQTFNIESFETNAFSKMKILVSEDFSGGDPALSKWDELDYTSSLEGGGQSTWNTVLSKDLDLSAYIGKEIVIAFKYTSEESDLHTWQLSRYTITAQEGTVTTLTYNFACFTKDPFADDIFYNFNLDDYGLKDTKVATLSGSPAEWKTKSEDAGSCFPETVLFISGHVKGGSPHIGITRRILPEVDLSGLEKASVRVLHSLGYSGSPESIKVQISKDMETWTDLSAFDQFFANNADNAYTDWISIPEDFMGSKVFIALVYNSFSQGEKISKPNWTFKKLEIKEDKE